MSKKMNIEKAYRFKKGNNVCYGVKQNGGLHQALKRAMQRAEVEVPPTHITNVRPKPLKLIGAPKEPIAYFEVESGSALDRVFDSVLSGVAQIGGVIDEATDVLSYIIPYGDSINLLTDVLLDLLNQEALNHNLTNNKMETTKEKILRIAKQPSTKAAIGLIATVIFAIFGINLEGEHVAAVLTESAAGIITLVFGAFTIYQTLENLFTDDNAKV